MRTIYTRLLMAWQIMLGHAVIANVDVLYNGFDEIRVDARDFGSLFAINMIIGWTPLDGNTERLRSVPTLRISRKEYLQRMKGR